MTPPAGVTPEQAAVEERRLIGVWDVYRFTGDMKRQASAWVDSQMARMVDLGWSARSLARLLGTSVGQPQRRVTRARLRRAQSGGGIPHPTETKPKKGHQGRSGGTPLPGGGR